MNLSEWMGSVVLFAALCSLALYFLSGNPSQKSVRLLCGLMMCAVSVLPLTNLVKNLRDFSQDALIIFRQEHTLESEEQSLSEYLIVQASEERLSLLLQEELQRRLSREDFSVRVYVDGRACLTCGENFPREQAQWILSALLGGCEVEIKEGETDETME